MLTTPQLLVLKTDILSPANAAALGPWLLAQDYPAIANWYNALASPAVNLWRPHIPVSELNTAIVWADFVALTLGKQNAYFAMTQDGWIDATSANIRTGFGAVFAGASQTNLVALAQRGGTRFEVLFSTVAGAASVSTMFGQSLSGDEVQRAVA